MAAVADANKACAVSKTGWVYLCVKCNAQNMVPGQEILKRAAAAKEAEVKKAAARATLTRRSLPFGRRSALPRPEPFKIQTACLTCKRQHVLVVLAQEADRIGSASETGQAASTGKLASSLPRQQGRPAPLADQTCSGFEDDGKPWWSEGEQQGGGPQQPEPPDEYVCPITRELMDDPVFATDGHTYERRAIEFWLATTASSPKTGETLEMTAVFPNHIMRRQIIEWREALARECACAQ